MQYYFDLYGWHTEEVLPGRDTEIAPPENIPEGFAANFTGHVWLVVPYVEPPPPEVPPVPEFVKKWQLLAGLRMDGIHAPVMAYIEGLPPAVQDLWDGSAGVERTSPFLAAFKAQFGKSEADLDGMFIRYAAITQADVLGLS
jgi:hypothetical protein